MKLRVVAFRKDKTDKFLAKQQQQDSKSEIRGKIKTDTTEAQRIIRYCIGQLYDNKLGNLGEMDKFKI